MTGLRILIFGIGVVTGLAFLRGPHAVRTVPTARVSPTVQQTSWKALYPAIADSVTLRFGNDSVSIASPTGVPILQSTYKLKNDIVSFHDYGGLNACADMSGSYHIKINGDTLVLVVDEDPCDARTGMLIIKPWIRKN
jgi:hypothetical protein